MARRKRVACGFIVPQAFFLLRTPELMPPKIPPRSGVKRSVAISGVFGEGMIVETKNQRPTSKWLILLIACGIIFLLFSILLSMRNRMRETLGHSLCPSNMRHIGQAILIYSLDHQHRFPDTIEELVVAEDITSDVFICPSSNDEKAEAKTPDETVAKIREAGFPTFNSPVSDSRHPRHCSYIYCGKGWTSDTVNPDAVLLYEPLSNHEGDGIDVLFGDGHVRFYVRDEAIKLIAKIPTTQPK